MENLSASRKEGCLTAKDKFLAKVKLLDGHLIWCGSKLSSGYGRAFFRGKMQPAHRISYLLFVGEIPEGFYVLQDCKIRLCVSPYHLKATQPVGPFGLKFSIPDAITVGLIRKRLEKPGVTVKMIAEEFNISSHHVTRIQHGTYRIGRAKV